MPALVIKLGTLARCARIKTLALPVLLATGVTPAQAQDLFGFLSRIFSPPVVRVPASPPYDYRTAPHFDRRVVRRSRVTRVEKPALKTPLQPKPLGYVTNAVAELLTDQTLRRGDIVMFPDGARVFIGQRGEQHSLADFKPIQQTTAVSQTTRKLVAKLRPGSDAAWTAANATSATAVAANTKDLETTGSVKRTRR
jgi:hypothetical protein